MSNTTPCRCKELVQERELELDPKRAISCHWAGEQTPLQSSLCGADRRAAEPTKAVLSAGTGLPATALPEL